MGFSSPHKAVNTCHPNTFCGVRADMIRNWSAWALLPPIYSVCTAAGLWLVYFVAIMNGQMAHLGTQHRRRNGSFYPPYISIAGNFPPASCIFSEVMNLAAFVGFFIALLRYLQLKRTSVKPWLNFVSLAAFTIGCFGMTLIGNFQVLNELEIHNVGTLMTFGLGILFCWMQSYITMSVNLRGEGRRIAILRFLLSGTVTVSMIVYQALMMLGHHVNAAQGQWALVMFFLMFLGTFAVEFRHNSFDIVCTEISGRSETYTDAFESELDQQ
ncbi:transmembrane protein 150C isoform X1 [Solea solea]|uniref:transmembrane protein 150C isoform X1 n=2 Tax=Solea solea TaxID=90069 RepID=UPI00272CE341|nr:transmembrane protein 150C isoform X1 [Solea solea]